MDALTIAQELVAIPSVSATSNREIAGQVQSLLERLGFTTLVQEFADPFGVPKFNVAGRRDGTAGGSKPGLAYFCHTDVVPVDSWSITEHGPFTPVIRDGRLYGRGSCDMKGSLASFLDAAARVPASAQTAPLTIVCTADEEVGFHGAKAFRSTPWFRELVTRQTPSVIGEPTELEVVHGHKGSYVFRATSRGRAAHSSTTLGLNANLAMIPFLQEMKQIHDEVLTDPAWRDDRYDPPTISWNIGINDHTPAVNITAPQSVCTVMFRPMPDQPARTLVDRAAAAAHRLGLEFVVTSDGNAFFADPQSEFVRTTVALAGKSASKTVAYGTDGVMFGELRQLLVLGPGSITQAHTDDEWIALDQLQRGADLYERLIRQFCCS